MCLEFINQLGFILENGSKEVYIKSYNGYKIEIDISKNNINYGDKIIIHRATTCNFNNLENLVVLECIDKLLTLGYKPGSIELEKPYGAGRKEKGQFLDILLKTENNQAFALIECKTFGEEHNKERVKMEQNGGQLFNYFSNQKDADFLILYSSDVKNRKNFRSDIINTKLIKNCPDKKSMMKAWDKTTEPNGFFENTTPYNFTPGLRKKDLIEISYSDIYSNSAEDNKTNGTIFNRFAEILRRHTVSDKSNAYNKIFNLFLCKIIDEQNSNNDDILKFQWKNEESPEDVIGRLNELYKVGMQKYMELDVTDHTEEEFKKALSIQNSPENQKALEMFNEIRLYKNNEFAFKEVINQRTFKENAKVVKEVVKLLERYQVEYSHKQQFLGDFFEKLLNIGVKQESGQFFTPVPIARFIVNSIPFESIIKNKIESKEKDYLPKCIDYACGSGHFLTESMDRIQKILDTNFDTSILSPEQKRMFNLWKTDEETKTAYSWASNFIYGIEKDYRLAKTTKVSCFLNGDGEAKILYADGLNSFNHEDYKGLIEKEKFDVVIANPPFSVEDFKSTLENGNNDFTLFKENGNNDIECLFMERTAQLLKEGGIVAVILPSTVLTNEGIHAKARKLFVLNFEIIAFQELFGTVFAATGNSTTVIFGRKRKSVDIISAEKLVNEFCETKQDFNYNGNKSIVHSFCKKIGIEFEEYIKDLCEKQKEKLKFFALTFNQKCLVSSYENGSGNGRKEKLFLGYEHSARKKYEGIHPFPKNSSGKINSKLYTEDKPLDAQKVSYYIYKTFLKEDIKEIEESLKENIMPCNFNDLINWNEESFNCYINTLEAKNSKQEEIKWKYQMKEMKNLVSSFYTGQNAPQDGVHFINGQLPFVRAKNLNDKNGNYLNLKIVDKINKIAISDCKLEIVPANTILFPTSGQSINTNNIAITPENCYIVNHLTGIYIDDIALSKYIFYFLKFIKTSTLSRNVSYPSIKLEAIKSLQTPLPPIEIQQKIVEEIEQIEKLQKNVEREREIGSYNLEISNLINHTRDGEDYKVSDLIAKNSIKTGVQLNKEKWDFQGKYPIISQEQKFISGFTNIKEGLISNVPLIAFGDHSLTLKYIDFPFFYGGDGLQFIQTKEEICKLKFFYYLLLNNVENLKKSKDYARHFSLLKEMNISIPSLERQKEILVKIEVLENKIKECNSKISNLQDGVNLIMQKYLIQD